MHFKWKATRTHGTQPNTFYIRRANNHLIHIILVCSTREFHLEGLVIILASVDSPKSHVPIF